MKKEYKVYNLRDVFGEIRYIGITTRSLSRRLGEHRRKSFIPTKLITIELIASFDEPREMFALEALLIAHYDLVKKGWNNSYGNIRLPENMYGKELETYLLSEAVFLDIKKKAENNAFWGCSHSEQVKIMISKRSKGNSYAKGLKQRLGQKNTSDHNFKIGNANGKKVICLDTKEIYYSQGDAARILGLHQSKISQVCLGLRKKTGGLKFAFLENYRTVEEKSSSKDTSLIAGNPLSFNDHNIIRNDKCEGLKTIENWAISSQAPEMEKVQRPVHSERRLQAKSKWEALNA